MLLKDKVVLVTGGAQGLGLAFTEIFLDQGAEVITFCCIDIDCLLTSADLQRYKLCTVVFT